MTHFPGGSNTRNNLLAYKYAREDFHRFQTILWPRRWISTLELKTCTLGHLYEVLFVRSTNSTMLCSLAQQKWTLVLYVWSSTERGYDQYDQYKYDCSSNWRLKLPCCSNGPYIL